MNAHEMSTQVMLAAERSAARRVWADMGFKTVGIVSGHMGLQIISAGESSRARVAFVFFARILLRVVVNSSKGAGVRHRRHDGQLRGHMRRRHSSLGASPIAQMSVIIGGSRVAHTTRTRAVVIRKAGAMLKRAGHGRAAWWSRG